MENLVLKGEFGLNYTVFSYISKYTNEQMFAWKGERGEGFANESLVYILDYLRQTRKVKI